MTKRLAVPLCFFVMIAAGCDSDRISKLEKENQEMKAKLDRSDKNAISAFNKAVQEHGQHVQQVNQEAADEEVIAKAYAADRAAADDQCASLTWRPADVDAVSRERKKAAAQAASGAL